MAKVRSVVKIQMAHDALHVISQQSKQVSASNYTVTKIPRDKNKLARGNGATFKTSHANNKPYIEGKLAHMTWL